MIGVGIGIRIDTSGRDPVSRGENRQYCWRILELRFAEPSTFSIGRQSVSTSCLDRFDG